MMNTTAKSVVTTLGVASIVGVAVVAPFVVLELRHNTLNLRQVPDYVALFGLLWMLRRHSW